MARKPINSVTQFQEHACRADSVKLLMEMPRHRETQDGFHVIWLAYLGTNRIIERLFLFISTWQINKTLTLERRVIARITRHHAARRMLPDIFPSLRVNTFNVRRHNRHANGFAKFD